MHSIHLGGEGGASFSPPAPREGRERGEGWRVREGKEGREERKRDFFRGKERDIERNEGREIREEGNRD